jgi:hypothetical protein
MPNTLNLAGDDDLYILQAVEAAFDLRISDNEAASIKTVGDFHDLLLRRLPSVTERSSRCLTACTYYALRRALRKRRPDLALNPNSKLSDFASMFDRKSFWKQLAAESGLHLPALEISLPATVIGVTMLASPIFWSFIPDPLAPYSILLAILSVPFMALAARSVPAECPTLGRLAEVTVAVNFRRLSERHETLRSRDVWDALILLIRQTTGARTPIDRNTTFIA